MPYRAADIADGNDVEASFAVVQSALRHIRSGQGPFFVELTTYRWREHCGPNFDNHIGYRSEEEFETWKAKDPVQQYAQLLLSRGWISPYDLQDMRDELDAELIHAFDFADASAFPSAEEAFSDLYAEQEVVLK